MNSDGTAYNLLLRLLRIGLVLALFAVWWSVYKRVPVDESDSGSSGTPQRQTLLTVNLHPADLTQGQTLEIPFDLYPVDLSAVEREFYSERRVGIRFDDFLSRKLHGRQTLQAKFDHEGIATVMVPQGVWWLYATLPGSATSEWRLQLNVSGERQNIVLTPDNQYMKWKAF